MNNYQQLQQNLHDLRLTQISLKIDDYITQLTHHSNIVNILGNSYRTATALSKISDKNN
ncbi:hypothetical protein ACQPUR_04705 [Clostridium neonatale]|uniref:hypothetical protein n=1 Tax=Clostridium neonatale TaxID=137838 RepID=UPI003D32487D